MKAIIPVAGAGTKLRPHTYTQPKALIPLAGKTILSIIVDQLMEGGITEFIFIVGYLGTKIQDYVKDKYPDLRSSFVFSNGKAWYRAGDFTDQRIWLPTTKYLLCWAIPSVSMTSGRSWKVQAPCWVLKEWMTRAISE